MAEELQMVEGSPDYELESQNGYLMEFNMTLLQICHISNSSILNQLQNFTGKSLSEALLFAEHGENMLCTKIVLNVRNNFCTQYVLPRFEFGIFM